ncbi:6-phosphogluconolactonase [Pseudomonas sp.]|uniref:6-phosphogluconolactonase n=1 Tax=Pseudomonas sp. TaxID=306 RepID=UPI00272A6983|nr:6-phosphogluconolactonase [Pseudomonas sp.]
MKLAELAHERRLPFDDAPSAEAHADALARRVAGALRAVLDARGSATLALSGGRSPEGFLKRLDRETLDWSKVTVTLVDERWVPPDHPDSNEGMVRRCLPVALANARWIPLYRGQDPEQDALQAERMLGGLMPVDVLVLGMGPDGHTASLFPGMPGLEEALPVKAPELVRAIPPDGERKARITMTGRALHQAKLLLLQINGEEKREVLRRAFSASPLELPIAEFLRPPLEIYYCPQG